VVDRRLLELVELGNRRDLPLRRLGWLRQRVGRLPGRGCGNINAVNNNNFGPNNIGNNANVGNRVGNNTFTLRDCLEMSRVTASRMVRVADTVSFL